MPGELRMTLPTQLVLEVLLTSPSDPMYGLEIGRAAGLASGTVHPILARLEYLGWLESDWESVDPQAAGRPRRRYYRLTRQGATRGHSVLEQVWSRRPAAPGVTRRPGLANGPGCAP